MHNPVSRRSASAECGRKKRQSSRLGMTNDVAKAAGYSEKYHSLPTVDNDWNSVDNWESSKDSFKRAASYVLRIFKFRIQNRLLLFRNINRQKHTDELRTASFLKSVKKKLNTIDIGIFLDISMSKSKLIFSYLFV